MAHSPLSVAKFRTIFIICWLALMLNITFVLRWYHPEWAWPVVITDSLISCSILFIFSLLIMTILRFYTPRQKNYFNIFIWCALLTGIWLVLTRWLLTLIPGKHEGYPEFLRQSMIIRGSFGFLILGCVTLAFVIWYNWTDQKENEKRKQDAEKLAREAELFNLRQQLQPHFLFNSLNSINALIAIQPLEARKMVQQLSDFLRSTLKKEEHQLVTLQEELLILQLYLDIEKVRFGYRLETVMESNAAARQMKLPALLLQPVVENAIKFGLYDTAGKTLIRVTAVAAGTQLVITVQNPFDPETSSAKRGMGFGLSSVQRRLYLLFGRNDLLTTEKKENIFTTIVTIPQYV